MPLVISNQQKWACKTLSHSFACFTHHTLWNFPGILSSDFISGSILMSQIYQEVSRYFMDRLTNTLRYLAIRCNVLLTIPSGRNTINEANTCFKIRDDVHLYILTLSKLKHTLTYQCKNLIWTEKKFNNKCSPFHNFDWMCRLYIIVCIPLISFTHFFNNQGEGVIRTQLFRIMCRLVTVDLENIGVLQTCNTY